MTKTATKIANHLSEQEPVLKAFQGSHIRLAREILMGGGNETTDDEPDWQKLLSWASVFSQSDLDEHVELALIASISALLTASTEPEMARQAAIFILESCSNTPTVKLAQDRGIVKPLAGPSRLPTLIRLYQRRFQHFIFDDFEGSVLPVTHFQERIWDALGREMDAALSAPTSAGKSFILIRWLAQSLLSSEPNAIYAYVVPSRALIGQISRNISKMLLDHGIRPRIVTLPSLFQESQARQTILVMTQERVERLLSVNSSISMKTIIIDEAHKLGEGPRGVILQRVIDDVLARSGDCRVVLAAPHAENADVLLPREVSLDTVQDSCIITDSRPTVLQNLIWVTPIPRRPARWNISLIKEQKIGDLGEIQLEGRPTGKKKRLAALAYQLGGDHGGNIVFTNGPAEAENVALLISGHLESSLNPEMVDAEVADLVKLVKDSVHSLYPLGKTLPYGIGIHYGDMPEICRREQERLFDEGKLSFLVCTSTLLEGVNLPCRNLFVWGPRQGRGRPMTEHEFWNLAGRAGRWGREFAGNIFCIDVMNENQWPNGAPYSRHARKVTHSGSKLFDNIKEFRNFSRSEDPAGASREKRYFEQILGELIGAHLDGRNISSIGWAHLGTEEQIKEIQDIVESTVGKITAPPELVKRHRGINPILISEFFDYLQSLPPQQAEEYMPMSPDMPDAMHVLSNNLHLIDEYLGGEFGNGAQRNLKAKITIDWIRGLPLGRIISERIKYLETQKTIRIPNEIRTVIKLINDNARYLIPKYLSCYSDCISHWFADIGRDDLAIEVGEIQDMLESGVAERTMIALISLGLSRTAAVEVAGHIPSSELSVDEVIAWLKGRQLETYSISPVIIREIDTALKTADFI